MDNNLFDEQHYLTFQKPEMNYKAILLVIIRDFKSAFDVFY